MKTVTIACPCCGGNFIRTQKQINVVVKRSGKWVCKTCSVTSRNISKSREIGSTRIHNASGYVFEKTDSGWRQQHIIVMEKILGRKLTRNEVVHHINEEKTDNSIENLKLMTPGEHSTLHNRATPVSKETARKIGISRQRYSIEKARTARELVAGGLSQRKAAFSLGMPPMVVSRIVRNLTYMEQ